MLGVPFLIILGMCAYQIKIENDRVKRDKSKYCLSSFQKATCFQKHSKVCMGS